MLNYKLKIGVVPIRRLIKEPPKRIGMFQSDYAVDNKNATLRYLRDNYQDENTTFIDLEWLNEEGLLRLPEDCERVAEYFKQEKIDALFIVNCNFGEERCASEVAKKLNVPTLLWGPRDRNFTNDLRYTDTQCGLFAISKGLKRANVKFSYIENCDVDAPQFDKGIKQFFSVACMVKNFKDMKIVQIGARLKPFKSIMYNELELAEKFGFDIISVNLVEAINEMKSIYENEREILRQDAFEIAKIYDCSSLSEENLLKTAATVRFFERIATTYNTNIVGTDCWSGFTSGWGVAPCLAMSLVAEKGIYVTCEGDVFMSITNALLVSATRGAGKPLQGEFTCRHPENDNAELLWHCGPFPISCKATEEKANLYNTKPTFRAQDGRYTIARFQAEKGKYYLLGGEFNTCKGPKTFGTYLWAEFDDLAALERKIIEGPYIHHMSEVYGEYDACLREFAKYFEDIQYDGLNS